jgi:hypothetical protein
MHLLSECWVHICKDITRLIVGLLMSQVLSVLYKIVYQHVIKNCCFVSDILHVRAVYQPLPLCLHCSLLTCCDVFLPAVLVLFFSCSAAHVAYLSGHVVCLWGRACMNNDTLAGVIHLIYYEFF